MAARMCRSNGRVELRNSLPNPGQFGAIRGRCEINPVTNRGPMQPTLRILIPLTFFAPTLGSLDSLDSYDPCPYQWCSVLSVLILDSCYPPYTGGINCVRRNTADSLSRQALFLNYTENALARAISNQNHTFDYTLIYQNYTTNITLNETIDYTIECGTRDYKRWVKDGPYLLSYCAVHVPWHLEDAASRIMCGGEVRQILQNTSDVIAPDVFSLSCESSLWIHENVYPWLLDANDTVVSENKTRYLQSSQNDTVSADVRESSLREWHPLSVYV